MSEHSEQRSPPSISVPHRSLLRCTVRLMRPDDALTIARYHKEAIPTAFLSRLGVRFLTHLYLAIACSAKAFVFVAVDPSDRVIGFVSGATEVKGLYRSVLLRRGWLYALILIPHVLRWSTVRRILETLFYPARVSREYPEPELLSIVVEPQAQGSGAATALLEAVKEEFRRRNCPVFRVLVGADLERPNAYYRKHGFKLIDRIDSHGVPSNVYTLETGLK